VLEPKPLLETHPHLGEFTAFLEVLNKESDRGAVLISVSMLDGLLERVLLAFCLETKESRRLISEGFNAPLSSFSARSVAAYSLGLISEREYNECDRLRKIRNGFAHNVHQSFDDQKMKDICAKLTFAAVGPPNAPVNAKGQYTTAAVGLILGLTNRPHYVARQRLKYGDWKI
jgi:DNA-binding MltR family transcriptional regulator